ncbi:MAG: LON peptidase substrate-binding domain-containing protein [Hyphomonadaceae bacterium]|nr:LON peptidase substrate-binding domain-containing protein [Hyphomonadaceae bacterium]
MSAHYKALAKRTNPDGLALFPLSGAVLLPGCDLPLNIFEPRYLNMIDDALKGERLIGMVQDLEDHGGLRDIGGLGRITQFSETEDGRYLVVLRGLKRFRITRELPQDRPYRQALISFDGFESDIDFHLPDNIPEAMRDKGRENRAALTLAMKIFAKALGVRVDWDSLSEIPLQRLVDQAAMISPFNPEDKQSLLEAETTEERRRLLIGLMHLYCSIHPGRDTPAARQ